jgi:large subunit ribosomal protein L32e
MVNPRKKPKFRRWLSQTYVRIKESWRKPKGSQSKVRKKLKSKIKMPNVGYGAPKKLRYLHPSGYREVLVHNVKELEKIDPEKEAARIAHSVGKKKRNEILKRAEELTIKVLNP